jgi:hypothetical protein
MIMNTEKLERDLLDKCAKLDGLEPEGQKKLIDDTMNHLQSEWDINITHIDTPELKILSSAVLTQATSSLNAELQDLLLQKERIERQLSKKSHALQSIKHQLFTLIEELLKEKGADHTSISKLHSIELQSMDLLNLLEEMVESAIITTLEKGSNIEETLEELAKEITIQTLDEGILSAERIRHVISTILRTAIEVAEASPNSAPAILEGTIKGMRTGLIRSLDIFNKKFLFTPDEAKMILIEDPHALYNELHHTDALFIHTIEALAAQSSPSIKSELENVLADIRYDMQELVLISKETIDVLGDKLSQLAKEAMQKSSDLLQSKKAQEAKKMGIHAWSVARSVIDGAIKGAKDAIDKK